MSKSKDKVKRPRKKWNGNVAGREVPSPTEPQASAQAQAQPEVAQPQASPPAQPQPAVEPAEVLPAEEAAEAEAEADTAELLDAAGDLGREGLKIFSGNLDEEPLPEGQPQAQDAQGDTPNGVAGGAEAQPASEQAGATEGEARPKPKSKLKQADKEAFYRKQADRIVKWGDKLGSFGTYVALRNATVKEDLTAFIETQHLKPFEEEWLSEPLAEKMMEAEWTFSADEALMLSLGAILTDRFMAFDKFMDLQKEKLAELKKANARAEARRGSVAGMRGDVDAEVVSATRDPGSGTVK